MKKRILSALLALAMVSTCLVGCGGNKSSESKSSGKVTKITIAVALIAIALCIFIIFPGIITTPVKLIFGS